MKLSFVQKNNAKKYQQTLLQNMHTHTNSHMHRHVCTLFWIILMPYPLWCTPQWPLFP